MDRLSLVFLILQEEFKHVKQYTNTKAHETKRESLDMKYRFQFCLQRWPCFMKSPCSFWSKSHTLHGRTQLSQSIPALVCAALRLQLIKNTARVTELLYLVLLTQLKCSRNRAVYEKCFGRDKVNNRKVNLMLLIWKGT